MYEQNEIVFERNFIEIKMKYHEVWLIEIVFMQIGMSMILSK
jgi:hypothetical protein